MQLARWLYLGLGLWLASCGHLVSQESPHALAGLPVDAGYGRPVEMLSYTAFTVAWDRQRQAPAWTAYYLPALADPVPPSTQRPSRFVSCPRAGSPGHDAYTRSGFDRGHLVPNYAIDVIFGRQAQIETFFTTNIAPQPPDHNRGPWMRLERKEFNWSQHYGGMWVITGVIYEDGYRRLSTGPAVPTGWFKVLTRRIDGEREETGHPYTTKAIVMPKQAGRDAPALQYRTTVRAVEAMSGWDFHPLWAPDKQETLETRLESWRLAPAPPRAENQPVSGAKHICINTAAQDELMSLPGIGPALSARIIAGRPFTRVEEIMLINGIGQATFERIRDHITIRR